jgi:25S rRNA (uracil2634-N3)-methyltransferase
LDGEFTQVVPNQRPEQCPRAKATSTAREGMLGYRGGMSVLAVGDGDFSFSLAIARILSKGHESGGKRLVSTSYECRATLERVYPNLVETLSELEGCGAQVAYQVDATRLTETLPTRILNAGDALRFHRIIWNFPCTAIGRGQDGQNSAMEENKDLVRQFVDNARHFLHSHGEIHMLHKTKPPYNHWKLEEVAVERSLGDPLMKFCGRVVLDRFTLSPYTPRKALQRKSFPCHDACLFVFRMESAKSYPDTGRFSFPSSIPIDTDTSDSKVVYCGSQLTTLVAVTRNLISEIRAIHLRRASERDAECIGKTNKRKRYKMP